MIAKLALDRPLAVFDIEATGISPRADRIIDLCIVRLMPDGSHSVHNYRLNPGIPIPPEATAIHGITDCDVAEAPGFAAVASEIHALLDGCDLGGYNVGRFDIPMLVEEFARVGVRFDADGCRVVDAQRIFHQKEPRDLSAAMRFYCGEEHAGAHGAEADVRATIRVLEAQFGRYPDIPRDVAGLDAFCNPRDPTWADRTGRLRWCDDRIVLNFGKNKGMPLRDLIEKEPAFIRWILRSDFPRDTRELIEGAMAGKWPAPPRPAG